MFKVSESLMWSLGKFTPTLYSGYEVGRQFHQFVLDRVVGTYYDAWYDGEAESRSPLRSLSGHKRRDGVQRWHRDSVTDPDKDEETTWFYLITWSNSVGTEFRRAGAAYKGEVFQGAPGEVIMAHNRHVLHRQPSDGYTPAQANRRWFCRMQARTTAEIIPVPGVYAYEFA